MRKTTLFCLAFMALFFSIQAQDSRFTQFWAAPMLVNPAWTGTIPHWRAAMLYRHQWYGVNNGIQSFYGSFDYNIGTGRGALGTWIQHDRISSLNANNLEAALSYVYRVRLSTAWQLSVALQGSYGQRTNGVEGLRFEDAILSGMPTAESFGTTTVRFPDLAAGLVAYSEKMWISTGVYHLLQPNRSSATQTDPTKIRITAQLGYRFNFAYDHYLVPAALVQYQNPFMQIDFGTNWEWQWLYTGLWYRGIPAQSGSDLFPSTSLAAITGIKTENWQFGISYDFAIASLTGVGGTYEVSLSYAPKYDPRRSRRGREEVECPINFR